MIEDEGQSSGGDTTRRSSVESIDDIHKTSSRMLVSLANNYSLYLKTDLSEQVRVSRASAVDLPKVDKFDAVKI
jgi:hypothetical protein